MSRNFEILKAITIEKSQADTWEETLVEWECENIARIPKSTCACSKYPIVEVCMMHNTKTGEKMDVGNCCVKRFFGQDFSKQFKVLKQKEKQDEWYKQFDEYVHKINGWREKAGKGSFVDNFLGSILQCKANGWALSEKQQQVYDKISFEYGEEIPAGKRSVYNFLKELKTKEGFETSFMNTVKGYFLSGKDLSDKQAKIFRDILKRNGKTMQDVINVEKGNQEFKPEDFDFGLMEPREWQLEAFAKWASGGYYSTVQASTGSGKSFLGYMALQQNPGCMVLIVVPTIKLAEQWKKNIEDLFPDTEVGLIKGGICDIKPITVAVVNSIRTRQLEQFDLLILDECHRYPSKYNWVFIDNNSFSKVLALTATVERQDGEHDKMLKKFPLCYELTQRDSIDLKYTSPYYLYNLSVEFEEEERREYDFYDNIVRANLPTYNNDLKDVLGAIRFGDDTAKQTMNAITQRKKIVQQSYSKTEGAFRLVLKEAEAGKKIMVFCEFIQSADDLFELIEQHNALAAADSDLIEQVTSVESVQIPVGKYHSKMKKKERDQMIQDFATGGIQVMISCKCLDEGLDVPAADVAIVMAGSSVKRQMIQRIGRVLRYQKDKMAIVYQLYIRACDIDVRWLDKRTKPFRGVAEDIIRMKLIEVL